MAGVKTRHRLAPYTHALLGGDKLCELAESECVAALDALHEVRSTVARVIAHNSRLREENAELLEQMKGQP